MPRCHSPFLVSNLPVTAINQALTPWWRGPLGGCSSDPPGLYECCCLTVLALTSPTSRQRQRSKDQYCPYTHLPDPQQLQTLTKGPNIWAKDGCTMWERAREKENFSLPHSSRSTSTSVSLLPHLRHVLHVMKMVALVKHLIGFFLSFHGHLR